MGCKHPEEGVICIWFSSGNENTKLSKVIVLSRCIHWVKQSGAYLFIESRRRDLGTMHMIMDR